MSYAGSPGAASEQKPALSHEKAASEHPVAEESKAASKEEDFASEAKLLRPKQTGPHISPKSEKAGHAAAKPSTPKPAPVKINHAEPSTPVKSRPGSTLANTTTGPAKSPTISRKPEMENKPETHPSHSQGLVSLGEPSLQTARARESGTKALGGIMASSLKTSTAALSGTRYRGRTY